MQNDTSMVFDSRHASTARLAHQVEALAVLVRPGRIDGRPDRGAAFAFDIEKRARQGPRARRRKRDRKPGRANSRERPMQQSLSPDNLKTPRNEMHGFRNPMRQWDLWSLYNAASAFDVAR
jgi:hypothetical protein